MSTSQPLHLIYLDVWGPSPIKSHDGFSYFGIFVDNFTKYVCLFLLKNKSDMQTVFIQFNSIVEFFFSKTYLIFFAPIMVVKLSN